MSEEGQEAHAAPELAPIEPLPPEPPPTELPPSELPRVTSGPAAGEIRRRSGTSLWLSLMLALVLVLIGASPYWAPSVIPLLPWHEQLGGPAAGTPSPASPAPGPAAAELDQRIAALEQKLARAPQPPARDPADAAAIARQQDALQALADRVMALEQRPVSAGTDGKAALAALEGQMGELDQANRRLAAAVADADRRLDRLEQAGGGERAESGDRLLLVALGELRNAIDHSGPYTNELTTAEALAHDRPEIAARMKPLEADAALGVPSLTVLTRNFAEHSVPAILRAAASEVPQESGWSDRLWARLRALVLIRRLDTGAAPANPVDRAIATAEAALNRGDLAGAVDSVAGLTGAPATAAAAWLAQARQRLTAETLLARLSQDVAGGIAAGSTGTKTGPASVAPDGQPALPPAPQPPAPQPPTTAPDAAD